MNDVDLIAIAAVCFPGRRKGWQRRRCCISQRDGVLAAQERTHLPEKVKRAVQITLVGGLSHLDSFDPKPELRRRHGQTLGMEHRPDTFFNQIGLLRGNDFDFRAAGRSGLRNLESVPAHRASTPTNMTMIRSMVADSANHTPALFVLNSGFQFNGYPALGGWLSFGLGSEADDLPAYVVLAGRSRRGERRCIQLDGRVSARPTSRRRLRQRAQSRRQPRAGPSRSAPRRRKPAGRSCGN